jgi:hypothetical protein
MLREEILLLWYTKKIIRIKGGERYKKKGDEFRLLLLLERSFDI